MAINFASIPSDVRVPGFYVEFDTSRASGGTASRKTLLTGQQLSSGTAIEGNFYLIGDKNQGFSLFGNKSQLGQMCRAYKEADPTAEVWAAPMDDATSTEAGGSVTWEGTATAPGVLVLYIGGRRVPVAVATGDDAADVETAALAALALNSDLPVTYAANAVTGVDFTANHGGTIGNQILLGVCLAPGESVPAGLTVTVTAMASGATDPDYDTIVTGMADDRYDTIVAGIETKTELDKIIAELESRWQPPREIAGVLFVAKPDSQADLTTYGNSFNTQVLSVAGYEESAYSRLPWEVAAKAAAVSEFQSRVDPSVATAGKSLGATTYAAPRGSRFSWTERNTLLSDGISTIKASTDGRMLMDFQITTYQTNSLGLPDLALSDLHHVRLLIAIRDSFKSWFSKYFNAKLADDGNDVSGQLYMTPEIGRAEALLWFKFLQEELGWVENYDQFEAELLVERDPNDVNRINFLLPPDLVNAMLVGAAKVSFLR